MARKGRPPAANCDAIEAGWKLVGEHPFYCGLLDRADPLATLAKPNAAAFSGTRNGWAQIRVGRDLLRGWGNPRATVVMSVVIAANAWRPGTPAEWAHVLAQALLHVAFNHVDPVRDDEAWRRACEWEAVRFLKAMPIGQRPPTLPLPLVEPPGGDLAAVAAWFATDGRETLEAAAGLGIAGAGAPGWFSNPDVGAFSEAWRRSMTDRLAAAIRGAVAAAIEETGTVARGPGGPRRDPNSLAERARSWFVTNYPLLAALAAAFEIVEDADLCERMEVSVAAVDAEAREVFINPYFPWTWETMQFVIAHELLHVGLRHHARRQGRDGFLWNVACDYVINGWLVEMGVGTMPAGCLLDIDLALETESAEAVYDRITGDLRIRRRLAKARTFRGVKLGDILGERPPGWWRGAGVDLDEFYRRALAEGLELHASCRGRGLLPGSLIEEIRALRQPPIPWDVALGHWLDEFFTPLERRRTYARASRRQSATPDIPRPVWERPLEPLRRRTFGVVLDTSGSMGPREIGRGLGAIAAYAASRDVPLVRVVQCDAGIHDMGYVEPEGLVGTVEIRGRGGTVLQPGIRALERAEDFPDDAPILVITDGLCDPLSIGRPHAFLMPEGARLPFPSRAPRFAFERDA